MTIATRLTERFGLKHPIVLAPMTPVSGGVLASAVAEAGGLGLIDRGYYACRTIVRAKDYVFTAYGKR